MGALYGCTAVTAARRRSPVQGLRQWLDITGEFLKGGRSELVAARLREVPHGPIAARLWRYLAEQADAFDARSQAGPRFSSN